MKPKLFKPLIFSLLCATFGMHAAKAQSGGGYTLKELQNAAVRNYPLLKNKALLGEVNGLTLKDIQTSWLPQASINGQATYQSQVPSIPIDLPFLHLPALQKDHYQLTLDAQQTIYDGGGTAARKTVQGMGDKVAQQQVDVELFQLRNRVTVLYFGALMARENAKLLDLTEKDLEAQIKQTQSAVSNGAMLSTNLDIIKAGIISLEQKKTENRYAGKEALDMLAALCGLDIQENTQLAVPEMTAPSATDTLSVRPELTLYGLQQQSVLAQQQLTRSQELPRLYAFGQAGWGKPGLDYFSNDFKPFYILGAKATWNISAFYTNKNELKIQNINATLINNQKLVFDKNTRITLRQQMDEILKVQALMEQDNSLIQLRERITKSTASQMQNGVVTATEYVLATDAQSQAAQNLELHKLQLQLAILNYQNTLGK